MTVDFKSFIKNMFRNMGGEILERDDDYIWVRTDSGLDIYKIVTDRPVNEADVIAFHRATEQVNANKIILCIKGITTPTKDMAKTLNIDIIDRKSLAYIVGEYVISSIEKGTDIPGIDADENEENETVEEDLEDFDYDLDEEEELEDMDTIPIILEDASDSPEKVIKSRISREEALAIADKIIGPANATLKLVPYHLFDYSLRIIIEGDTMERSASGIIAVNGITGEYEIWREGYETETSNRYSD
ncbi:MAG: hypothetical protein GXO25_01535 [Euryarchaeota archaeon]|nr:hypothetical protein [Euryarchaeota archaeon]